MRNFQIVFLVLGLMAAQTSMGQGNDAGKATRLQNTRYWEKEIPMYKKVLENGAQPNVMEKLADCYRMTGDLEKAEVWYRNAIVNGNQNTSCRLNYAKVLQSNGKYQEAKDQFVLYEEITGEYAMGDKYIASCEMAMKLKDDHKRYEIQPVARLNTNYSDIIAINTRDEIVFATRGKRSEIGSLRNVKEKSESSDYDFYLAGKHSDGTIADIKPIKGGINSPYDDVSAVKMPGSDLVLFTRSEDQTASKKKTVGNNEAVREVKILGAKKNGKKMEQVGDLPVNFADGNSNFHPAVHPNGDMIVFASDRQGGEGGTDLYMIRRVDGKWSKPENLGPSVNSAGDELFPTFNKQGHLFFASDGNVGYGGLDLFTADFEDNSWSGTTNMGSGINSPKDDFGIIWDASTSSGYFNSNRNPNSGDDIYSFKRTPGITGQVFDGLTKEPLAGSIVRLKDINGNEKIIISDGIGQFSEPCKDNTGYLVTIDAPGFHTWRDTFWTKSIPQGRDINLDVYLEVEQMFEMNGMVHDQADGFRLGNADIQIIQDGKVQRTLNATADSADYRLRLKPGEDYTVIFRKDEYVPRIVNLSLTNFRGVEVRTRNVPMTRGGYVLVNGSIMEDGTAGTPISHASIQIVNNRTQEVVDSAMSLKNGTFWVAIPWDSLSNYSIISAKEGYFATSKHIEVVDTNNMTINIAMRDADFGLDNSIKVIHYGYNQTTLDMISKKDLNEIYFFLMRNPVAKLEVRSHTDSRGTSKYNLELSRRRSESVIQYIQARKPIPTERFIAWGFGEEFLLNECLDGVNCDENAHAMNRRTELKVVEGVKSE
jgi:outer membrane protein OmpA-like peptidoglycan-associated protein